MSYDAEESSAAGGRPYFLFLLTDDTAEGTARLTSHAEDLVRMSETWTASPIGTGDFEQTGQIERQELKLTFPLSDEFARRHLDVRVAITSLTVWRGHLTDLTNELRVVWKGRIVDAYATPDEAIELVAESIFTSMRRPGNRMRVQRTCAWTVYQPGCNLDREDFEEPGTVTAVSGLTLTVPEAATAPAGDYTNGIVNWNGVFGTVVKHSGSTLTLLTDIPGLAEEVDVNGPAAVLLAPGCNRRSPRCTARFNNILNMLGFEFLPQQNPFNTSIV